MGCDRHQTDEPDFSFKPTYQCSNREIRFSLLFFLSCTCAQITLRSFLAVSMAISSEKVTSWKPGTGSSVIKVHVWWVSSVYLGGPVGIVTVNNQMCLLGLDWLWISFPKKEYSRKSKNKSLAYDPKRVLMLTGTIPSTLVGWRMVQ